MKKLLLIGGGAVLLLTAIVFGAFFAGPLLASANSNSAANSAAGTPTTNPYCEQYLQDLAHRLNVSVTTLQQDKQGARTDVLNQMVKDGKLTQAQANTIEQRMQSHQACTGKGNGIPHFVIAQFLQKYRTQIENSVASSLHMTSAQLTAQLQAGQSLSQIAASKGVTSTQLQTIVTNAVQSALNSAVSHGDMTQAQATGFLQSLKSHPAALNRILNAHPNSKGKVKA